MAVNRYVRVNGQWVPVGTVVAPPFAPVPPPPGGTITHGEQIPAWSKQALSVVGPRLSAGGLSEWSGSTTLSGTQVIEGRSFTNKTLTIAAGARITLRNCRIIGPPTQTAYLIRVTGGGGVWLTVEDCELVARAGSTSVRCIVMWGDGNVEVRRSVLRGGIDNIYVNPDHTPGRIPTGDPLVPMARLLVEDCWLGDIERMPGTHTDCIQIDGGGYTVIRRSRIMCFNIPWGADTLTSHADGSEAGSGGIIATQNSNNPSQISHVAVRDCWCDGGNWVVDLTPADGLPVHTVAVTGCRFGLNHTFGALLVPAGEVNRDNRWGASGVTVQAGAVAAGQLVPGSTA